MTNTDPIEQLLTTSYHPEPISSDFTARLTLMLTDAAKAEAERREQAATARLTKIRHRFVAASIVTASLAASVIFFYAHHQLNDRSPAESIAEVTETEPGLTPRLVTSTPLQTLAVGATLTTKAGERRLVTLADGSRLFVDAQTSLRYQATRSLILDKGQIYLEVAPRPDDRFVVISGERKITALGTHFAVKEANKGPDVVVTQGKVAIEGVKGEVTTGRQLVSGSSEITEAPRVSHLLAWTRELLAAAETPLVPSCKYAGGSLLALDPNGQEVTLSLRKYTVDVHIEDGFARTTIDQTYFNTLYSQSEGTFYFPLPADASLSRLAMYVADGANQCQLMEGGMAERGHAANVYETIRHQRRDPALLEWLDGSTFKMRVFPLEGRQEKRIILSYTQRVPSLFGQQRYRFPGGHSMPIVGEWAFKARIKNGSELKVSSSSHPEMDILPMTGDMVAQTSAKAIKPVADVVLEIQDRAAQGQHEQARFSTSFHENQHYLMLRYRPDLAQTPRRERRDWVILFESSASRDPLLAGTQVEILKHLLRNAEYDDTFTLISANSQVQAFANEPRSLTSANLAEAEKFLAQTHLVGGLDLEQGLRSAVFACKNAKNPHLLHLGSGVPVLGERDASTLAKIIPESVRYVGIGVGKRWNRSFMKQAAERSAGHFTQINPDEVLAWRAFDLLATLNTPRLLDVRVVDPAHKVEYLLETSHISQGEEICAIARIQPEQLPGKLLVQGKLDGKPFVREVVVQNVQDKADYLPRTWGRLEIDRLLAAGAEKNKATIIDLSRKLVVMSPFTSLLVLETAADYERYQIDRGRQDHWARYDSPPKIPRVYEAVKMPELSDEAKRAEQVLHSFVSRARFPDSYPWARGVVATVHGIGSINISNTVEFEGLTEFDMDLGFMKDRRASISYPGLINLEEEITQDRTINRNLFDTFDGNRAAARSRGTNFDIHITDQRSLHFQQGRNRVYRLPSVLSEYPVGDLVVPIEESLGDYIGYRGYSARRDLDRNSDIQTFNSIDFFPPSLALIVRSRERLAHRGGRFGGPNLFDNSTRSDEFRDILIQVKETHTGSFMIAAGITEGVDFSPNQSVIRKYTRPTIELKPAFFSDLVQFAPGLHNSRADYLAALEHEGGIAKPIAGKIDPEARKLIDQARQVGCYDVHRWSGDARIRFNGKGQYSYERRGKTQLQEVVTCNGQTLVHCYPELGLAARREMSRFHRAAFASQFPWLVLDADDLACDHDLISIAPDTIRIMPHLSDEERKQPYIVEQLVFGKDYKLLERQAVQMPEGKVLLRQCNELREEKIRLYDFAGKLLVEKSIHISFLEPWPFKLPDTSDLLTVQMPLRNPDQVVKQSKTHNLPEEKQDREEMRQLFVSRALSGQHQLAQRTFATHLYNKEPKLGYYTLLAAGGQSFRMPDVDPKEYRPDPVKEYPNSPLADYLARQQRWLFHGVQPNVEFDFNRQGFFDQLGQFQQLWLTWAVQPSTTLQRFFSNCQEPAFAAAMLSRIEEQSKKPVDPYLLSLLVRFEDRDRPLGLGTRFRYELARSNWLTGDKEAAYSQFCSLHQDLVKQHVLLPLETTFLESLKNPPKGQPNLVAYAKQHTTRMMKEAKYNLALAFAAQMSNLDQSETSFAILNTIVHEAPAKARISIWLVALELMLQQENTNDTEHLIHKLLAEPKLAKSSELWRLHSQVCAGLNLNEKAIRSLEKALELEYPNLPEMIDLEYFRKDHRQLLSFYLEQANALKRTRRPTGTLEAKTVRITDRWRQVDPETSESSRFAGEIFHRLGRKEKAWEYWTSPLDRHPDESAAWAELATDLQKIGDTAQADRALATACAVEPTNAEILYRRALFLREIGQWEAGTDLLNRVATEPWQERFQGIVNQARTKLAMPK